MKKKPVKKPTKKQPKQAIDDPYDAEMRMLVESMSAHLRWLRQLNDLSLADVARELGVTRGRIQALESGLRDLQVTTLARLLRIYGVPLQSFFFDVWRVTPDDDRYREFFQKLAARKQR